MKQRFFVFCTFTLLITSCNLPMTATPTPVVQTETPIVIPTNTISTGNVVTLNNVSLTLPAGLANNAEVETIPAATDPNTATWELAPAHLKITLTGYLLQGKFLEPQILVYPADEYAQVNSFAAEQIDRLKKILAGSPLLKETMPVVPSFNAVQQIAANMQVLPFQSGSGIRMLTQYDQYPAPINNHELFYHFEGLTSDGKYYIIAVLPVTAPILPEDEKADSPVPAGGVPFPADTGPNDVYYTSVTEKLISLPPDSFTPSLNTLDALIQSILVTNP